MSHGLWKRRRARKEAHVWRERKHHVGELVQMDGSHHAWLEEMRLAGVKSLEEANAFLERYLEIFNHRFMKEPLEPGDLHRSLPKSVNLDDVLCIKGVRTINEGYLVKWRGRTFVLAKGSLTLRRQKVTVLDRFDGRLSLRFKGRDLAYREVQEPRPVAPRPVLVKPRRKPPKYYPPPTHPWRHYSFGTAHP
jgi:hypothetical protein